MNYPKELTCFVCDRELDSIMPPYELDEGHTPYNGTMFTTYGHYGSTIFDEMGESQLSLTICDPCIVKKAKYISLVKKNKIERDGETVQKTSYGSFEISNNSIEWVHKASGSIMLTYLTPIRTMEDGTRLEYIKHSDNTIHLKINNKEKTFQNENDFFVSNNGEKYKVEWLRLKQTQATINDGIIGFHKEDNSHGE